MNIDELTERIKSTFFFTDDLICRPIKLADKDALIVFLDGGVDKSLLDRDVISPLSRIEKFDDTIENVLRANTFYAEDIKVVPTKDCPKNVASGDVVLAVNGDENAYVYSLRSPEKRAPSEPPTESVMKGPREGFIEDVKTNLSLVRRRIKSPALTVKMLTVGRYSSTSVAVVYMSGIADEKIVGEIISKIKAIDIDGVIDSAYVLAYLRPKKHSFFLQAGSTEKPDVASAKLLEGRIAIVVDGSPIVITLPYLIFEDVHSI